MLKKLKLNGSMNLQDVLELTPKKKKKKILFIIGDWNAKVGSQELPGVTGKFGLGVQNEAQQRLIEFCQEMHSSEQTPSSNNRRLYTRTSPDGQY